MFEPEASKRGKAHELGCEFGLELLVKAGVAGAEGHLSENAVESLLGKRAVAGGKNPDN